MVYSTLSEAYPPQRNVNSNLVKHVYSQPVKTPYTQSINGYDPSSLNLTSSVSAPVHFNIQNQNHYGPSRSNSTPHGMYPSSLNLELRNKLRQDTNAITCGGCFEHLNNCNSCKIRAKQILSRANFSHMNVDTEGFSSNSNETKLLKKINRMERFIEVVALVGIGYAIANLK